MDEEKEFHPLTGKGLFVDLKYNNFKYKRVEVHKYDAKTNRFSGIWVSSR